MKILKQKKTKNKMFKYIRNKHFENAVANKRVKLKFSVKIEKTEIKVLTHTIFMCAHALRIYTIKPNTVHTGGDWV